MDENSMYTFNTNNDTIIVGTNEDDNIVNIADNVTIDTGDGDDNIISGLGNLLSTIDDSFAIGNENVSIASGNGNDSIMNIGDYVTINAGNDDDYVSIADVNSIGSAIILGGAGDDTINAGNTDNNSYVGGYPAYTTGHKNHTVDGGTGNDYISFMAPLDYSGPDSNMFIYREGDGDDTIYAVKMDYSYVQDSITGLIDTSTYTGETVIDFSTVIQIDSSSQPTSVNSGADLIIKVGDGSITFIGQAGQSLDIVDPSGGTINLVDDGTGATDTDTGSTDTDTNTETTNTDSTNPVSDGSLLKGDTDIVFLIDTSGSMGTYIERVRNALNSFADSLSSANVSYRLGLVDFGYDGNGSSNNYIKSYSFVEDVESFKNELANLPSYGAYEYGLAAIDTALNLDFREDAKKRFVMFTDEGYEENTSQSETILAELGDADVILDVVGRMGTSKGDCQYEWQPMANATGGNFYDISSLDGALNKIAENITTPVINVNLKDVPDGDAGVFLLYSTTDENGSTTFSSNATFISMGFTPYEYNGHYYGIYTNQSSWEDAETFCESWGGHLAIINDADENTALYDYMKSQGYDYAFFGLSDSDTEETWVWVNGEGVTYHNCAEGEPGGGTEENYALLYEDGKWVDAGFSAGSAFICEWDIGDIEDFKVVGTVTDEKIYAADSSANFRQNITIPNSWNVTATDKDDTLNVTGNDATVAGGDGKDSFVIGNDADGIIFADLSITEDKLSFENAIPENSLDYSTVTAVALYSGDIHMTFANQTEITANFKSYQVTNGDHINTISELMKAPPIVIDESEVMMSFAHWEYGVTAETISSAS